MNIKGKSVMRINPGGEVSLPVVAAVVALLAMHEKFQAMLHGPEEPAEEEPLEEKEP